MRCFLEEIRNKVLVYDGSKGYMLQKMGLKSSECCESWNISHKDEVKQVYRMYMEAGSDVIQTNTFPGNRVHLDRYSLGNKVYEINYEGARLAREVMGEDGFVAASIGPTGKLFEPSGDLSFDKAYDVFKEQVRSLADGGVDIINFETFTDIAELRAALLAAKDTADLPVICSATFETNGKTLMGTDPYTAAVILRSLGADMIGTNCSFGPGQLLDIIRVMYEAGGMYLCVKPNAGLPELCDGTAVYKETAEGFAGMSGEFIRNGVRLIGGCCGTTPEFIKALRLNADGVTVPELHHKSELVITSATKLLNIDKSGKINTGSFITQHIARLRDEFLNGNFECIIDRALDFSDYGCDAVYINTDAIVKGGRLLADVVNTAQGYLKLPFIMETNDSDALAFALRLYKGKAGVVIDGETGNDPEALLAVAKRYGSTVIDKSTMELQ